MVGLLDCNNFYVSCERVFKPWLNGKPVIVLSNNDGCAVSRSNEAKALGIRMGAPLHEVQHIIKQNNVHVFSSNYALYGDMSSRIVATVNRLLPDTEVYSIDELFASFRGFSLSDTKRLGREAVETVRRGTGIPVSFGIAATKTLAKVANKAAKKDARLKGVCVIVDPVPLLKRTQVGDVWGIGSRYAKFLNRYGIKTAYDLRKAHRTWVKKHLTVTGLRTWEELNGNPVIGEEPTSPKKHICVSRAFGKMQTDIMAIREAVSNHAVRAAEKLRKQGSRAANITVFLQSNVFRPDLPQHSASTTLRVATPTNSNIELCKLAVEGASSIYRAGVPYKKAGVFLSDIRKQVAVQGNLFEDCDTKKQDNLMQVVDKINKKHGRDCLRLSSQGYGQKGWKLKQNMLSQRYTTRLEDVLDVTV